MLWKINDTSETRPEAELVHDEAVFQCHNKSNTGSLQSVHSGQAQQHMLLLS